MRSYREALAGFPSAASFPHRSSRPQINLLPVEQPDAGGYLMAKIFRLRQTDHYYSVEFTAPVGWDRACLSTWCWS